MSEKGKGLGKLRPQQQMFVQEYLVDKHGTNAAIRAGYSAKTARIQAAQLLTRPNIKAAVALGLEKQAQRLQISADDVVQEFAKIGFAAIKAGDIKPSDKLTALTKLGDHFGLFKDGGFLPPAGQGIGDGGNQFQQYNFMNVTQEEGTRMYREMISRARLPEPAKPVKGQRVR